MARRMACVHTGSRLWLLFAGSNGDGSGDGTRQMSSGPFATCGTAAQVGACSASSAMVLLALQALLGRDFDNVMVVSEERSPKCARLGQLRLICRSKLPFLMCGFGFNASPSQFLGDTHIHILIGVES